MSKKKTNDTQMELFSKFSEEEQEQAESQIEESEIKDEAILYLEQILTNVSFFIQNKKYLKPV